MARFTRQSSTRFEGPAGRIELLPEGVVYVRIDTDGEVNDDVVHDILLCVNVLSRQQRPLVLIDRMREYWLSFEAQQVVAAYTDVAAVAYWIRRAVSAHVADHAKIAYFRRCPVRAFKFKGDAIQWLTEFQPTAPKMVWSGPALRE